MRAEQMANGETPRYDGRCAHLPRKDRAIGKRGKPHVIRMRVPTEGICQVQDMLRGTVEIPWDPSRYASAAKNRRHANVSSSQRRR